MYCVLDIESSGGPFGKEAMIEIAAFRYDGEEVVDQLISLIHPHREVQPFVQKMTGINNKMLTRAPRFHELAKRLVQITEEAIIVGHNVEFDYRMLRQEFARLGYQFERKTIDTIPLSEELIPDLKSYGLDAVCDALGIYRQNKHRAESDARATLELFRILMEKDRQKKISILGQSVVANDFFKDKLNDLRRSVKHNKGIFYLHDREGKLLYLGASDNIKSALNRLFMAQSKQAQQLREQTHSIRIEPVGNWLVARAKRNQELQENCPPFNRASPERWKVGVIAKKLDQKQPDFTVKAWDADPEEHFLLRVNNQKAAFRAIRMFRRIKEPEKRALILSLLKDFPNQMLFEGKGRKASERCILVVENHHLIGYRYFHLNDQVQNLERLKKNMTEWKVSEAQDELLKLGIFSGEFKPIKVKKA